jgi:hypothetical protein
VNKYEETYDYSKSEISDIYPIVIDSSDVVHNINQMKNKHGGNDLLPSMYVIKSCLNSFSSMICYIFTIFFEYNMLPHCFKAPLYKGKASRRQAKNNRRIALLNIYRKIFERYLFSRFNRIESQLIPEQHGFRKDRSCMSALRIFHR